MSNETKSHGDVDVENVSLTSSELIIDERSADSTLKFMETVGYKLIEGKEFTPEIRSRISKKKALYLLSLLVSINTVLFIDKSSIGYGTLLYFFKDADITDGQYDDGNSIFYVGYFVGQFPFAYLLQKYNFGKSVSFILFAWSLIIFFTIFVKTYAGYIIVRLLLGLFESAIIPAIEISLSQFWTPKERTLINQIWWISCVGVPPIIAGFISYGLLFSESSIHPWKFFMIFTGGLTFINSILSFFFYPSDPSEAKWLTSEEKAFLIKEIQETSNSSIAQKTVKYYQIKECLLDPISWLIALIIFFLMISNNLMFQSNILYLSLGISNLGSTLINVAGGGFAIIVQTSGALYTYYYDNTIFVTSIVSIIPALAGGIAMVTIPWDNKLALVAMLVMIGNTFGLAFINVIGWSSSSCSGQTKKYYRNVLTFIFYSVSNIISPQIWKGNQGTRYYPAWIVQIICSFVIAPILIFIVWFILKKRNNERLKYIAEHPDEKPQGQVKTIDPETGEEIIEIVDIANLDLTDLENKFFIYPL
ncbi:hypothetical protein WICMUC_002438 [Wickerhamomyces mucosus]|uniref:Major facilitator superfamily (MFS) profile domain-containing protein n=1 Tax=Wickerhamomyces mucosus TaxID=1378264 RepID=A0A9P8PP78_9ASCO|nr:hypothetical protein WICMUC_002438 [Wickerhamomyces mucosus]